MASSLNAFVQKSGSEAEIEWAKTKKSISSWWMTSQAKLLSYEVMLDGLGENLIKANSAKEALEVAAQDTKWRWC